jgi:hypothetical protein
MSSAAAAVSSCSSKEEPPSQEERAEKGAGDAAAEEEHVEAEEAGDEDEEAGETIDLGPRVSIKEQLEKDKVSSAVHLAYSCLAAPTENRAWFRCFIEVTALIRNQ